MASVPDLNIDELLKADDCDIITQDVDDSDVEFVEMTVPISLEAPKRSHGNAKKLKRKAKSAPSWNSLPSKAVKRFRKLVFSSDQTPQKIEYIDITSEENNERVLVQAPSNSAAFERPIKKIKVTRELLNQERAALHNLKEALKLFSKAQCVNVRNLADGGVKITANIQIKEKEIADQKAYLNTLYVENEDADDDVVSTTQPEARTSALPTTSTCKWIRRPCSNRTADYALAMFKSLQEPFSSIPQEHELAEQPSGMQIKLKEYQLHALVWMKWCERKQPHGGILADDMGLGKKPTALALVLYRRDGHNDDDTNVYNDNGVDDFDIDYDDSDDDNSEDANYEEDDEDSNVDEQSFDGKPNFEATQIKNR